VSLVHFFIAIDFFPRVLTLSSIHTSKEQSSEEFSSSLYLYFITTWFWSTNTCDKPSLSCLELFFAGSPIHPLGALTSVEASLQKQTKKRLVLEKNKHSALSSG
jgi:hypothetical protein